MTPVQDRRPMMFLEAKRDIRRPYLSCKHCARPTHEGKAECIEHLSKRPYIAALFQKMEQHEKDVIRIEKQGTRAVKLDGMHVSEILNELRMYGPKTVEGLKRATRFSETIVLACAKKMRQAGLVKTLTNNRGSMVVGLTAENVM